ncbi:MAG: redoxin domain-containing protein [Nitrospinae bacterium]|nr:redoxin domain-containing protein [Nitrospinota bacterium]
MEANIWERSKDNGLRIFAIGVKEERRSCEKWIDEHDLSYPVIPDIEGSIFKNYADGSVPYNVIIDKDLKVIYSSGEKFNEDKIYEILKRLF